MYKKNLLALSTSVLCTAMAFPSLATANQALTLEEIIVTAQKRLENVQDIPVSMLAVTSDALNRQNLNDLQQLYLAAPGLQVGQDNTFAMRGVGTLAFGDTLDSSVALAVDDVNYGRPALGGAAFNDVERIEVLYGPQGMLFGKNASAGLLNVITVAPRLGVTEGSLDTEYVVRSSTPDDGTGLLTKGTINLPVSDKSALRINALYSTQDPVAKHEGGGGKVDEEAEQKAIKVKYLQEVGDSLEVYVIADYSQERGTAGIFDRTFREVGAGSPIAGVLAGEGIEAGDENLSYQTDGDMFRDLDTGGLQASVYYELDNGMEFFNVTSWRYYDREQQIDVDYTSSNGVSYNYNDTAYDQYSTEFRLAVPEDNRLNGQVGLYYFYSEVESESVLAGNAGAPSFAVPPGFTILGSDSISESSVESVAVFSQFNYDVTDELNLIMGARLTHDKVDIDLLSGQNTNYFVNIGGFPGLFPDDDSNTNITWKLGAQYYVTPDVMSYATISTGYKAPGFNDSAVSADDDLSVDEETSINYEAGVKSTLMDGRVMLNASVFYQEFEDYQVQSFDPSAQTFKTRNAAEVTVQGVEFSVTALLLEDLTLSNSITYLDSTFDDFPGAQCYPGQSDPSCAVDGDFNAKGNTLPLAAELTSTTQLMYEFAVNDEIDAFIEGNWYYRSDINFKSNEAPMTELDSINIYGLSMGVEAENWSVSLFCKNCTDEKVPTFIDFDAGDFVAGIASTTQAWGFNSVRTVGVKVGVQF